MRSATAHCAGERSRGARADYRPAPNQGWATFYAQLGFALRLPGPRGRPCSYLSPQPRQLSQSDGKSQMLSSQPRGSPGGVPFVRTPGSALRFPDSNAPGASQLGRWTSVLAPLSMPTRPRYPLVRHRNSRRPRWLPAQCPWRQLSRTAQSRSPRDSRPESRHQA